MKNIEDILTKEKFEQWLKSQQPDDVVGLACRAACCPIATYINANLNFKYVGATRTYISSIDHGSNDGEAQRTPAPSWVYPFIQAVDRGSCHITASEALTALNNIRE